MTSEPIDRVFGRGRLQMVTGAHVEVFREAAAPGESRRYTKRFLTTAEGDYAQWTEREWRILARLIGHGTRCVPDVVQYDRDARGTKLVQTYDAGATVDQWATLLPVERDNRVHAHAFEDCAHWWALAHHCLVALDEIHTLQLVHLDVKGDNICIPIGPANFNPAAPGQRMFPVFRKLALIDFAFSLVSGETLTTPLPIGWQQDYDYQSPRLLQALETGRAGDLQPTEDLDWRCDMYSLAAMLKRYLPGEHRLYESGLAYGWTLERYDAAKALILRIRAAHDRELSSRRPHAELITRTSGELGANELAQSLDRGWTLARDAQPSAVPALPLTPITRLAPPIRLVLPARADLVTVRSGTSAHERRHTSSQAANLRSRVPLLMAAACVAAVVGIVPLFADTGALMRHATQVVVDGSRAMGAALRRVGQRDAADATIASETPPIEQVTQRDAADGTSASGTPPIEQVTRSDSASTATEPVDEVTGGEVPASAGEPANDVTSGSAPSSESGIAASEKFPQSESPRTSPPAESAQTKSQSTTAARWSSTTPSPQASLTHDTSTTPSAQATLTGDSLAAPMKAYRSKPLARSTPRARTASSSTSTAAIQLSAQPQRRSSARTASSPMSTAAIQVSAQPQRRSSARTAPSLTPTVARASNARAADSTRRGQLARTNKAPRPAVFPGAIASRAQPTLASKRASGALIVASSQMPGRTPAPPVASPAASASSPAVVQSAAPVVEAKAAASYSPKGAPTVAGAATQDSATPTSPAQGVTVASAPSQSMPDARLSATPPSTSAAVTFSIAPPVETPRAIHAPNTLASTPGMAPIVEGSRTFVAPAVEAPRGLSSPSGVEAPRNRPAPVTISDDSEYLDQARQTLASVVPRTAAQAHAQIARVLWVAANAHHPAQERAVIDAAKSAGIASDGSFVAREIAPREARRLHEEARQAYWSRRYVPEAFELELKAFGANPNDPEIAGYLAFLHLKLLPAQPERARQLALHAIGTRNAQHPTGRADDWMTFAIASALTGRQTDARHALYALLALTRNLDRSCRTALGALATFGDRMREPVEALLHRLHAQGRADDSPYCVWPPSRIAGSRYP